MFSSRKITISTKEYLDNINRANDDNQVRRGLNKSA